MSTRGTSLKIGLSEFNLCSVAHSYWCGKSFRGHVGRIQFLCGVHCHWVISLICYYWQCVVCGIEQLNACIMFFHLQMKIFGSMMRSPLALLWCRAKTVAPGWSKSSTVCVGVFFDATDAGKPFCGLFVFYIYTHDIFTFRSCLSPSFSFSLPTSPSHSECTCVCIRAPTDFRVSLRCVCVGAAHILHIRSTPTFWRVTLFHFLSTW